MSGDFSISPSQRVLGRPEAQKTLQKFEENYGFSGNDFVNGLIGARYTVSQKTGAGNLNGKAASEDSQQSRQFDKSKLKLKRLRDPSKNAERQDQEEISRTPAQSNFVDEPIDLLNQGEENQEFSLFDAVSYRYRVIQKRWAP